MTEDSGDAGQSGTPRTWREGHVWASLWVGLGLSLVGLIDGLAMALNGHLAPCPDGTYFPEDAIDFDCYLYPQAGLGIAIMVFSVLLGILLVYGALLAADSVSARVAADRT